MSAFQPAFCPGCRYYLTPGQRVCSNCAQRSLVLTPTAALRLLVADIDSVGNPPAQLLLALAKARETLDAENVS